MTAFLVHVVDVTGWYAVLSDDLLELSNVIIDSWLVECLSTFGVKARWFTELKLVTVAVLECIEPASTGLLSAEKLDLEMDLLPRNWMSGFAEKEKPVDESSLLELGEELLMWMGMDGGFVSSSNAVVKGAKLDIGAVGIDSAKIIKNSSIVPILLRCSGQN